MDSSNTCLGLMSTEDCEWHCDRRIASYIQNKLDAPMPWIGIYIAAASAVCAIAMAADVVRGLRSRKFWFPCKYFSLNATSLTLLGVAMKLSVDLSVKLGVKNSIAGVSSLALMTIVVGNFTLSVASMHDNEILTNLTALGILVVTIVVNVCIFNVQTFVVFYDFFFWIEHLWAIVFMLLLLILLCSSAVVVPTSKKCVELKFREMHKMVLNGKVLDRKISLDELRIVLKKYWVMVETGNPQFVMARSVSCVVPGFVCFLMGLSVLEAYIRTPFSYQGFSEELSSYRWSMNWILYTQTVAVAIGIIAPISRCFVAMHYSALKIGHGSLRDELKVESYWTQRLVEWRESPLPSRIRHLRWKKLLHASKRLLLNVCIKIQVMIVFASKLVLVFSVRCTRMLLMLFRHTSRAKIYSLRTSSDTTEVESRAAGMDELDFGRYVLLLEGEAELPKQVIANICREVDKLIEVGKMQKPRELITLLQKSENFNCVTEFDSNEVPSLNVQEPPSCWSLALVTLTSIAIALPNISKHHVDRLLSAVSEGLSFVRLIEKALYKNGELMNIRNTANIVWVGVELYRKWQDRDIVQGTKNTYMDMLYELSDVAKKTVMDFKIGTTDMVMENPLNWPVKVIAANSMYRTCQTLLLIEKDGTECLADEQIFEQISVIISDILAACLTNLLQVIVGKCQHKVIEKRQESIREAAVLFGESEEVLKLLLQRDWPILATGTSGYIEAWQALFQKEHKHQGFRVLTTDDDRSVLQSSYGHVAIELGV